jgi:DNA-binding MarR family transcriptional regulator
VKRRARASSVESVHTPLGDVLGFLQLLWAIDHALQLVSKRLRSSVGITGPQRLVLRLIGHFERLSPGELSQVLWVDPSSLTGVLRRLERSGLVTRTRDPKDGRRAILTLTKRGRAVHLRHAGTVESSVRRTLAAVSPADIAAARDVLAALSSELEVEAGLGSAKRQTARKSTTRPPRPRRRRSLPT